MDIDAYLRGIGVTASQLINGADPDSLKLIYSQHVRSLPFSSVPISCNHPVDADLDVTRIADKMLNKRWGGVCFEHVALLGAALERLRFDVAYLGGEIWRNGWTPTHTHASLLVSFPDRTQYHCDVGFPLRPLEPLLLADGKEQMQSDGRVFMLETLPQTDLDPEPERDPSSDPKLAPQGEADAGAASSSSSSRCWGLQQLDKDGDFELRHRFRLQPCALSDFAGPARELSTPGHRFSSGWLMAAFRPDGALVTLAAGHWAGSEVPVDKAKYVCRRVVVAGGDGGRSQQQQHVQHTTQLTHGSAALRSLALSEFGIRTEHLGCAALEGGEGDA